MKRKDMIIMIPSDSWLTEPLVHEFDNLTSDERALAAEAWVDNFFRHIVEVLPEVWPVLKQHDHREIRSISFLDQNTSHELRLVIPAAADVADAAMRLCVQQLRNVEAV
jgi:hypothetical protein